MFSPAVVGDGEVSLVCADQIAIVARPTSEIVLSRTPAQCVVAIVAEQDVVAPVPVELVIAAAAGQLVVACVAAEEVGARLAPGVIGARATGHDVVAVPGRHERDAGPTFHHVVAVLTIGRDAAVGKADEVVALPSLHDRLRRHHVDIAAANHQVSLPAPPHTWPSPVIWSLPSSPSR